MPSFQQICQTIDGKIQMVDENGRVTVTELGANTSTSAPIALLGVHDLNMEPAKDVKTDAPVAFVKLEDLDATSSLSAVPASTQAAPAVTTAKSSSTSKPPKKRRSWGQELPEPVTNLPPRKRAKTADEKEQRRIERVKRNRQAAHNSRERKRQEHESLEVENERLKIQVQELQAEIASLRRQGSTSSESQSSISPVIPPLTNENETTLRRFMTDTSNNSPVLGSESLFTAEQLPLMGTVAPASTSFTTQTSTNNTPVLSNSSDFTSPATEPLPFTPTIDSLDLGQTRQFARLSRQDDLQCHPLVLGSMMLLIFATVLSATSLYSSPTRLVGTSTPCGPHRSLPLLALGFIILLLSYTAPILACVSLTPVMTFWGKLSNSTSRLNRAPRALCAMFGLPSKIMPLSNRTSSNRVVTSVLYETCSGSTSVGWG